MNTGFGSGNISFCHPKSVFYAGQTLSGNVNFTLIEPLSFLAIKVHINGATKVLWKGLEEGREIKYMAEEVYFNESVTVLGGTGEVHKLQVGTHSLPFTFVIPHNCPSSFYHELGHVSYSATATAEQATQEKITADFFVVAPFDLNKGSPRVKEPVKMEFEEEYNCCFDSKLMQIDIRLPASGYCPGMNIPIEIKVLNEGPFEIRQMNFKLYSKYRFGSRECYDGAITLTRPNEFITPHKTLSEITVGAILTSKKVRTLTRLLPVPSMIPPYLENCSLIRVGYFFKARIQIGGYTGDLEDEREICLGLVPLYGMTTDYVHPMKDDLPYGPIPSPIAAAQQDPAPPGVYPDKATRIPHQTPSAPLDTPDEYYSDSPIILQSYSDHISSPPYSGEDFSMSPPYPIDNSSVHGQGMPMPTGHDLGLSNGYLNPIGSRSHSTHDLPHPTDDDPLRKPKEDPPPSYDCIVDEHSAHPRKSSAPYDPDTASSTNHEPSSTRHESSTTHHESSVTHHEPSVTHHEPSFTHHEPSVTHHEPSVTHHEPSATCHESNVTHEPSAPSYESSATYDEPSATSDDYSSYD